MKIDLTGICFHELHWNWQGICALDEEPDDEAVEETQEADHLVDDSGSGIVESVSVANEEAWGVVKELSITWEKDIENRDPHALLLVDVVEIGKLDRKRGVEVLQRQRIPFLEASIDNGTT